MNDPVKAPDDEVRFDLEKAADEFIAAAGGARAAVLALLIANEAHEHELHHTRLQVSSGYSRQRYVKRKTEDASQT